MDNGLVALMDCSVVTQFVGGVLSEAAGLQCSACHTITRKTVFCSAL